MRVRYIGPDCAILAGTYILHGEEREVSAAQLAAAQLDHPHGFAVLDEPVPEVVQVPTPISLNEPAPPAGPALDPPAVPTVTAHRPATRRR